MEKSLIQQIKERFRLIGHSDRLDAALHVAVQVAETDMSVLIHGPSGCGKESFSQIIHTLGKRRHQAFIAVNCGAIPEGTIDSELFGHEKGAFTGAQEARKGYFETANKGTIFLDEVGEMPLSTQARLLRVLENGEFIRVGSSHSKRTDVRIIAATNANLRQAISEKKFREDLYYRLNTVPIYVPALSERKEDIALLFESFLIDACERYKREPIQLDESAVAALEEAHFPGNIRQLKNIAEQVSLLERAPQLSSEAIQNYLPKREEWLPAPIDTPSSRAANEQELLYQLLLELRHDVHELKRLNHQLLQSRSDPQHLLSEYGGLFEKVPKASSSATPYALPSTQQDQTPVAQSEAQIEDVTHEQSYLEERFSLQSQEREMIERALRKYEYKRKLAAEELGISERTLYRKIKQYGLFV